MKNTKKNTIKKTNLDGTEIEIGFVKKKKKLNKHNKSNSVVGNDMYYIGKTKATGSRIVFYEGKIKEELKDHYVCEVYDRNIHESDELFIIKPPKKSITIHY